MSKIIHFNKLKNKQSKKQNINSNINQVKASKVFTLLGDGEQHKALEYSESLIEEHGFVREFCEAVLVSITINSENFTDEQLNKYLSYAKEIYDLFEDVELISYYTLSFYLYNINKIKYIEDIDVSFKTIFTKIQQDFPENQSIAILYSALLLEKLQDFSTTNELSKKESYFSIVDTFHTLLLDFEGTVDIAINFANFLYLSSTKIKDKLLIEKSKDLLKNLLSDYNNDEEILTFYCLFISINMIKDSSFQSIKYINEFKQIIRQSDDLKLKEIYFITLYNLTFNVDYCDSHYIIGQMKDCIYMLEEANFENILEFAELLSESLSNYSCDSTQSINTINDKILPDMSTLINKFGQTDNLIMDYCIVLYNISCLIQYYNDDDSPHIDVFNELENCSNHFDIAIPYYCLALSNLIHLNSKEFGRSIVEKIFSFLSEFDDDNVPKTKNEYSLKSIYATSIANLIDLEDVTKCNELLLNIKTLILDSSCSQSEYVSAVADSTNSNNNSYNINFIDAPDEISLQLLSQYVRALTFYSEKLDESNGNYIHRLLEKFNSYLV